MIIQIQAQSAMAQFEEDSRHARDRVQAKIRYARPMFEEFRAHSSRGDDFDIAHEEACLAHLDGAVDAFLRKISVCRQLGIPPPREVTLAAVRGRLGEKKEDCAEFTELTRLLDPESGSWLAVMREYRNQQVHRAVVNRDYQLVIGVDTNPMRILLRNPQIGKSDQHDRVDLVQSWLRQSEELFERLGASLRSSVGPPGY